jgi:hypothetical protein
LERVVLVTTRMGRSVLLVLGQTLILLVLLAVAVGVLIRKMVLLVLLAGAVVLTIQVLYELGA